jgi:PucR family transcriptional regulator, purine catabolism regulatory protein
METIKYFFSQHDKQLLINHDEHHINIYVSDHFQNKQEKQGFFHSLMTSLTSFFPGSDFYLGVSKRTQSILGAKHAYKEAIGAIRMILSKSKIIYYDSLGVIGALLNEKNEEVVREMAKSLLNQLELDCHKNVELITTLYSFLINGGNLEKTAEEMSLSISGLRYRVHKLEDLLGMDIRNPVICCQLLLALQGLILLGDLAINNILDR